jgi:hypothetical protein
MTVRLLDLCDQATSFDLADRAARHRSRAIRHKDPRIGRIEAQNVKSMMGFFRIQ